MQRHKSISGKERRQQQNKQAGDEENKKRISLLALLFYFFFFHFSLFFVSLVFNLCLTSERKKRDLFCLNACAF